MKTLNKMYSKVKNQKKKKKQNIYLPNDKEILCAKERSKKGIPIDQVFYNEIKIFQKI